MIKTTKQFPNYFDDRAKVKTLFCDVADPKITRPDEIAALKGAWREADCLVSRALTKASQNMPDEDMDDPLRPDVADPLEANFFKKHGFIIPGNWRGPAGLLGRIHREFMNRKTHTHFVIRQFPLKCPSVYDNRHGRGEQNKTNMT